MGKRSMGARQVFTVATFGDFCTTMRITKKKSVEFGS